MNAKNTKGQFVLERRRVKTSASSVEPVELQARRDRVPIPAVPNAGRLRCMAATRLRPLEGARFQGVGTGFLERPVDKAGFLRQFPGNWPPVDAFWEAPPAGLSHIYYSWEKP